MKRYIIFKIKNKICNIIDISKFNILKYKYKEMTSHILVSLSKNDKTFRAELWEKNDKEPFCTEIKNLTFKIKEKGKNQVDEYAEIYLTSDLKASEFGDKYLNFQHTF